MLHKEKAGLLTNLNTAIQGKKLNMAIQGRKIGTVDYLYSLTIPTMQGSVTKITG